jgi:hypothetical protein
VLRLADGEPGGMRLLGPGEAQELVVTLEFARADRSHASCGG